MSKLIDPALAEHLLSSTHIWAAHSFYHIVNAAQDTNLSKISLIQLLVNSVPTVIRFWKEFITRNHKTVLFWRNWWEKPICVCPWDVSSKAWLENWDTGFQANSKKVLHWTKVFNNYLYNSSISSPSQGWGLLVLRVKQLNIGRTLLPSMHSLVP